MMSYEEFIQNILDTRGRFACGEKYHEQHHIMPKCLGGTDNKDNLIDLYAQEHFIAHKLLSQENPDNDKLAYAFWMMSHIKDENQQRYEVTPEEYEEAKVAFSVIHSKRMKGLFAGEKHPNYGKHPSDETLEKMSKSHSGEKNHFYNIL